MEERATLPDEGESFGRYRLITKIASGGMGEIYLARLEGEGGFEKLLVIKRLLPELVASEEFRTMFVNEARIAAQLSHPNICDIYELGQVGHEYFLAMQYLQGVSLADIARTEKPIDRDHVRLVAGVIEQTCAGLHHAHELTDAAGGSYRIVHRDVSPSNVMATFDGVAKVLDFGIATMQGVPRMTSKGSIRGKFAYMSPEQISGMKLDRTSDVFSLGIVMYEALTLRRMFQRPSEYLVAKAILEDEYPDAHASAPAVAAELSAVLARALARKPDQRYQTARAMAEAIRDAMAGDGGAMSAAEIGERLRDNFADELEHQRGQYDNATARFERAPADHTESLGGPPPLRTVTPATRSLHAPAVAPAPEAEPAPPARRGNVRVAAMALAALAAGMFVAWLLSRPAAGTTAVDAGRVAAAHTMPVVAAAHTMPVDAAAVAQRADASPPLASPIETDAAAAAPPAPPRTRRAKHHRPRPRHVRSHKRTTAAPGYLNVDSFPFATIYVDDTRIDITPIPKLPLSPGVHQLRARLKDGRTRTLPIRIRSGKTTRKRVDDW